MTILDSQGRPFQQNQDQPSTGTQLYEQSEHARQYVTQNVQSYPIAAVFISSLIGYGLAYLVHGGGNSGRERRAYRPEYRNHPDQMRRDRVPHTGEIIGHDVPDESKERHTEIAVDAGRTMGGGNAR